jgi:hypothetical protein
MKNYKAMKALGKVSPRKEGTSLQTIHKRYDEETGEEGDDIIKKHSLVDVKNEIIKCNEALAKVQAEKDDWEQLESDLKELFPDGDSTGY